MWTSTPATFMRNDFTTQAFHSYLFVSYYIRISSRGVQNPVTHLRCSFLWKALSQMASRVITPLTLYVSFYNNLTENLIKTNYWKTQSFSLILLFEFLLSIYSQFFFPTCFFLMITIELNKPIYRGQGATFVMKLNSVI